MHWRNSNFQIAYFLAGKCHTPDEAYRQLMQLHEERDVAIKTAHAAVKRSEAKVLRAQKKIDDPNADPAEKLEAEADLLEIEATRDQAQACYDEAIRERDFIQDLIERVKPHRKYGHLPDHEAHQAAQLEEWREELVFRAQNFLATGGMIPADHFATMRQHPDFERAILPVIHESVALLQAGKEPKLSAPRMTQVLLLDHKE